MNTYFCYSFKNLIYCVVSAPDVDTARETAALVDPKLSTGAVQLFEEARTALNNLVRLSGSSFLGWLRYESLPYTVKTVEGGRSYHIIETVTGDLMAICSTKERAELVLSALLEQERT